MLLTMLVVSCLVATSPAAVKAADDAKTALQGVWNAQSMEVDGKPASAETVKHMRFTFKDDKLLMRGNVKDDSETECTYTVDPKPSPKHMDIVAPGQARPILAIYELKGDELKICLRHARSTAGRPTEFATKANSLLILIVFKKQKS
jgi:uncharacterized protein (TIGR03067 family)